MIRYLRERFGGGGEAAEEQPPRYRVLMVCMGNICRSPLAEGVLRNRLETRDPPLGVLVDSAGTHGYHVGTPPDHRAQSAAQRRGVDISAQRARMVQPEDFETFDLILAMDEDNLGHLLERAPAEHHHKIRLYLEYTGTGSSRVVPDPYYGGLTGFERVLDLVEEASDALLAQLEALLPPPMAGDDAPAGEQAPAAEKPPE